MKHLVIGNATLYCGDSREILEGIHADVYITDPPWDQAKGIAGAEDPRGLFADVAGYLARARCVCVQLGCYTDPVFCSPLAARMPFFHTCWLRYVPSSYNGRVLVDADVAYVYGKPVRSMPGRRVIPSMATMTRREPEEQDFKRRHGKNRTSAEAAETTAKMAHPMPRVTKHVRWLTEWHSEPTDIVCDPFMGSGTAGVAAMDLGRKFIGIEIEPRFFDLACERIDQAQRQQRIA